MFVIHFISTLLSLYAILLLVNFALPYLTSAQQPWMTVLDKICEPGVKIGNCIADIIEKGEDAIAEVTERVIALCKKYPLYENDVQF